MRIGYQLHLLDLALNVSFELLLRQNLLLDFLGLLLQLPSMLKSQRHRAFSIQTHNTEYFYFYYYYYYREYF